VVVAPKVVVARDRDHRRDGGHENGEEEQLTITRGEIEVQTVRSFRRNRDGYLLAETPDIGYIRVTQFGQGTTSELREAVKRLKQTGAKGVILDLRFNPGGLLRAAVKTSDLFLEEGKEVVSVRGRKVEPETHEATRKTPMPDIPIVVLANEASASAAESSPPRRRALRRNDRSSANTSGGVVAVFESNPSATEASASNHSRTGAVPTDRRTFEDGLVTRVTPSMARPRRPST